MLCSDTGSLEAIHLPMRVEEARDISNALEAVRLHGHGTGEVCIPLVNGIFDKIRIAMVAYRAKHKKTVLN